MLAITSETRSSWVQFPSHLYKANKEREGLRVSYNEVGLVREQVMLEEGVELKGCQCDSWTICLKGPVVSTKGLGESILHLKKKKKVCYHSRRY